MWDISVVESDAKESGHDLFVFFLSLQLAPNSIQHDGSTTYIDQPLQLHRNPSKSSIFIFIHADEKDHQHFFDSRH